MRQPVRNLTMGTARLVAICLALTVAVSSAHAGEGKAIPPPTADAAVENDSAAVAVLAGGCFWGVQGVFQHTKGVKNAVSGYAGGDQSTANYKMVTRGTTGHAEAVRITYDPREISYGKLLQVFFSVAHDPTQLNRQGPDIGTQYRSAVFPVNAEQMRVAKAYIAQLDAAKSFDAPIVTNIEVGRLFYAAEDYHQDFMTVNPSHPYIIYNDLPKIEDLKVHFPTLYRSQPALVSQAKSSN